MIDFTSLNATLPFFHTYGYLIVFLSMAIEGPIITYIAALMSSLGYFNIFIIFALSILGNQLPDMGFYCLGRLMRVRTIEKILRFLKFKKKNIIWIERNLKKHVIKSIILIKTVPIVPGFGISMIGFAKVDFKKFFFTTLIYNILVSIILTVLGFFSGIAINVASRYINIVEITLPLIVLATIAIYFLFKLISRKVGLKFTGNLKANSKR